MTWYKYDSRLGLVDDTGKQILQILAIGCSQKFRAMAIKEMANKLNTIERGKQRS